LRMGNALGVAVSSDANVIAGADIQPGRFRGLQVR
jgi:hypothetical protein